MSDAVARLNAALEGRYAIERELGEGGMATVSLADDRCHRPYWESRPGYRRARGRRVPRLGALVGFWVATLIASVAMAQSVPRVILGFGVDTTSAAWSDLSWHSEVPEIYRAWSEYLLNQPGRLSPNPRWSAQEQREWPAYDLTSVIAYNRASATVVDIRPVRENDLDEFIVKTLFSRVLGENRDVKPVALTRVYAFRENGEWVFGNALTRLTSDWERVQVGPIEYVVEPGRELDRTRAERAVTFADSLSLTFDVPRLQGLTYYVAGSPESLHRIMGVDWTFGGIGYGYAAAANDLILSGDPTFGEENRHELAHVLLGPLLSEGPTHALISEGMATWLGGSMGQTFEQLIAEYADYLEAFPETTVDSVLTANNDEGLRPTGAVLLELVHDHGGVSAVKELIGTGRSDEELRLALSRVLGVPWQEVVVRWREHVLAAARQR